MHSLDAGKPEGILVDQCFENGPFRLWDAERDDLSIMASPPAYQNFMAAANDGEFDVEALLQSTGRWLCSSLHQVDTDERVEIMYERGRIYIRNSIEHERSFWSTLMAWTIFLRKVRENTLTLASVAQAA